MEDERSVLNPAFPSSTPALADRCGEVAGRDFVVLADHWGGLPTSTEHLARRLLGRDRVFWFNTTNRFPRLTWSDARKTIRVASSWFARGGDSSASEAGPAPGRPHVAAPAMVPWFKRPVRRWNGRSFLRTYDRLAREHHIRDPIVLSVFPSTVDFVRSIEAPVRLYYCVDEWLDYPGLNRRDWAQMEDELLACVDGLIVSSRTLASKNRWGKPWLYLPHGVDFAHFHEAAARREPVPAMEAIRKPIAGFFGLVSEWIDLELIRHLAMALPDVSFVLIGNATVDTGLLGGCRNVHLLGPKRYEDLPKYARYFDVGLVPFVASPLTMAVNPLKLLEYYALGIPVVATRLPELELAGGPIGLAAGHDEFEVLLAETLAADRDAAREEATAVAGRNTWDSRVEALDRFIDSLCGGRVA